MQILFKYYFPILICLLSIPAKSQTSLPYSTGFDDAIQKAGWQSFRSGVTTTSTWGYSSTQYYSATNSVLHDHPIGAGVTDTTEDWWVSPAFNLSNGGFLSVKLIAYSPSGSMLPEDLFEAYVFQGSANPNLAIKTNLASFSSYVSTSTSSWHDSSNIVIPPSSGASYIAFRYRAVQNWFATFIDNVSITGNPSGIEPLETAPFSISPNPASSYLLIHTPANVSFPIRPSDIRVCNTLGESQNFEYAFSSNSISINLGNIKPGIYFISFPTYQKGERELKFIKY